MPKSVVINLGTGDLYRGLPRVTAQVWMEERSRPEQVVGSLPEATGLVGLYRDWRLLYRNLCDRKPLRSASSINHDLDNATDQGFEDEDFEIDESGITNISQGHLYLFRFR